MNALLNIAINVARNAGKHVITYMDKVTDNSISLKSKQEFMDEFKNSIYEETSSLIHNAYPEHKTSYDNEIDLLKDDYVWIIDVIDGVVNYIHGFPHFSISVAIKNKNAIQHGVVYDPVRQELFFASKGEGAYLNDYRIRVSQNKDLKDALLGTGFPYKQNQHLKPYVSTFSKLFPEIDGVRRSGSSALDLAYVAAARLDGFWEFSLKEANMAAGILLVKEAGGLVSDFQGNDNYLENGNLVAGTPKIFKVLLQKINSVLDDEFV